MDPQQIVVMFAEINAKLDTFKTFKERLAKVEAMHELLESPIGNQTPSRNNQHNNTDNPPNLDAQYLKSIKIYVSNFDGRQDSQLFINWTLQLHRYFTWFELAEPKKINTLQWSCLTKLVSIGST